MDSPARRGVRKAQSHRHRAQLVGRWRHRQSARTCFEGPFGEVLRATYANPLVRQSLGGGGFRFSTKYQDEESDLLYYGYRYYTASMGKWLSRDQFQELGTVNLYAFGPNSPISGFDRDGRLWTDPLGGRGPRPPSGPLPRPYPPQTPFPPQLLKKYDCSCCGAKEIQDSKDDLISRFNQAQQNLDKRGLRPNGDADEPGEASCDTANGAILNFMNPTPRCWICFMDRRWGGILNVWDENFIHCYTVNNRGIRDEIIFDWFDHAYHGSSGVYQDVEDYYRRYDRQADQYKNTPVYADCSKPTDAWKADFTKFDFMFDPTRRDPPVNRPR